MTGMESSFELLNSIGIPDSQSEHIFSRRKLSVESLTMKSGSGNPRIIYTFKHIFVNNLIWTSVIQGAELE